ncbi:hypothetical protein [Desulfosoma caldarium]|uniref:GGDEF domain-containing protein n=1 Tax=Desulfosoma caldarium TaxID=610254 RepID=A0A3N1VI59_9BACT|nr:hypothetical protein [Desulfosoma caldarium]ROR01590.1 hypothetical protein EDC27_0769 [Desulfosoma caldarium]
MMPTFQSVVNWLSNVLDAYTVAFFVLDPLKSGFRLVTYQSLSKHLQRSLSLPKDGSGLLSQVHKVGHTVHLGKVEVEKFSGSLPFYREGEEGIKGLLVTPVAGEQGLLYVDTKRHWGFNDKQQKWIHETARILEQLLDQHQRLHERDSFSRILTLWHDLIEEWTRARSRTEAAQALAQGCATYVRADFAFLVERGCAERFYRFVGAAGKVPQRLLHTPVPVDSRGLVIEALEASKPLFIPALNPDSSDHFLFVAGERLPHQGSLWVLNGGSPQLGPLGLALLSKKRLSLTQDDRVAVEKSFRIFEAFYERWLYQHTYAEWTCKDGASGFLTPWAFATHVKEAVHAALQNSEPLSVVILQYEPWQYAQAVIPPSELDVWERALMESLKRHVPPGIVVGRLAQNRCALLSLGGELRDLLAVADHLRRVCGGLPGPKKKRLALKTFVGHAQMPQDGVTYDELWMVACQRLFEALHGASKASAEGATASDKISN